MRVTIHQPEHLPWLGFFEKAQKSDVFVLLDDVQYRKNYFQNRNRILGGSGILWLTVPVLSKGKSEQPICDVLINNDGAPRWAEKCFSSVKQAYAKAPFWKAHELFLHELYAKKWERLVDMNEHIIHYFLTALALPVKLLRSSSLGIDAKKGDLVFEICRKVGATSYLSGISGRDYLNENQFKSAGIELQFQEFHHPIYRQLHTPFVPCLSFLDLLLNHGPASADILKGIGVETIKEVFN